MPRIGMRIIKTAIAVFLCFSVDLIRENGIVFYSVIAAILCMQSEISDMIKTAKMRMFATIVGGLCGMVFLIFESNFFRIEPQILRYLVLSIMVIPLIYFNVVIKKPASAYLTCVVFLSITVSHVNDLNPYLFAFHRIMDTLIGIAIAYLVNCLHWPKIQCQKEFLVLDANPLMKRKNLDGTLKYKINQALDRGLKLTFTSSKIYIYPFLKDLRLNLPFILLNGAIMYEPLNRHYIHPVFLDNQVMKRLRKELSNYPQFIYEHNLDKLVIHHQNLETEAQKIFYDRTHLAEFHFFYYHSGDYIVEGDVVTMMLVEPKENLTVIQEILKPYEQQIRILIEEEDWLKEAFIIRIISVNASVEQQIIHIQEQFPSSPYLTSRISFDHSESYIRSIKQACKNK